MRRHVFVFAIFFFILAVHAGFSLYARPLKAVWANVPPAPSALGAASIGIGDKELAYRMIGVMIQNLGDTGGDVTPLYKYNYDRLGQWFVLEDGLDWRSDFIPLLAAYYFGGTQNPGQLDPLIDYLAMTGNRTYDQKWRWLAQAAYLARFHQKDLDKAMTLARTLQAMDVPDMPVWAKDMPVFIANAKGDKQTALSIMLAVLRDENRNLHPTEVNFMIDYICNRILDETEKKKYEFCSAPVPH